MIDPRVATAVADLYRQADGFLPHLLTLQVIAHGGGDCWEPPSKAALKRALRRPKDGGVMSDGDLNSTVHHAVSMGLLDSSSTPARLALNTGGGESL